MGKQPFLSPPSGICWFKLSPRNFFYAVSLLLRICWKVQMEMHHPAKARCFLLPKGLPKGHVSC